MREYFEDVKGVRPDHPLSADVQKHLVEVFGAPAATLSVVGAQLTRLAAAAARNFDDSMSICYWWQVSGYGTTTDPVDRSLCRAVRLLTLTHCGTQGDGEILASIQFKWDEKWMQDRLAAHLAFWQGDAAPALVEPSEAVKCRSCMFQAQCPGGTASLRTRIAYG